MNQKREVLTRTAQLEVCVAVARARKSARRRAHLKAPVRKMRVLGRNRTILEWRLTWPREAAIG